jgi:cobalt-zinc-cadmium efflux system outer membrane protein
VRLSSIVFRQVTSMSSALASATLGAGASLLVSVCALAQTALPQQLFEPPVYRGNAFSFDRVVAPERRAVPSGAFVLSEAVRRAVAANPRLTAAERDIGIATGRRIQAGAFPNPELSFEIDDAFGSGPYRGLNAAETTLQLSQVFELGGKREARIAAGAAEVDAARFQRLALRLEIASETATAFLTVLSGQRRVQIYDTQIRALERVLPQLQRRVDAGASSPAEIARAQIAADLVRAERERARTTVAVARRELSAAMGMQNPDFGELVGDLARTGNPPPFPAIVRTLERNPQLVRFTALRAQRDADLLSARLKPIPDVKVNAGWRHYRDSNDNAVRVGVAVALPVWDQNLGGITEASEARAKTEAEHAAARASLILTLGKAYETMIGALRELEPLRDSAIPNVRRAVEGIESGYAQGRFTLLDILDVQNSATQTAVREQEVLMNFHIAVATIEALTGAPVGLTFARAK